MYYQVNEILLKFLHADQLHSGLPLYSNNKLNSSRDWHSFEFTGKLFHKMLPPNFNECIPYFWEFTSGTKDLFKIIINYNNCKNLLQ